MEPNSPLLLATPSPPLAPPPPPPPPPSATPATRKTEAMDLDFVKRKPRFPKLASHTKLVKDKRSRQNISYALFFPLHAQFWTEKVPGTQVLPLSVLYVLYAAALFAELGWGSGSRYEELAMPLVLLLVYSVLLARASSASESGEAPVFEVQSPPPPPSFAQGTSSSGSSKKKKPASSNASSSDYSEESSSSDDDGEEPGADKEDSIGKRNKSVVSVRRSLLLLGSTGSGAAVHIGEEDKPPLRTRSSEDAVDGVKILHWSTVTGHAEKMLLTPVQIRIELEEKCLQRDMRDKTDFYFKLAVVGAVALGLCPVLFRGWKFGGGVVVGREMLDAVVGHTFREQATCAVCAVAAGFLSWVILNHIAGAVDTFERRYLYAKYFSWLTSSRKAQRAGLPYFRLHKVEAIKVWLSLRSRRTELDLEQIGPYKASDVLAHFLFTSAIVVVGFVAFRAMQQFDNNGVPATLQDWVVLVWAVLLSVYVQRITSLANKAQERFSNTSVLLTEELNIHMHLLRKPNKKEELQACNQMLKVAGSLIKELEGNKNKKGGGHGEAFVLDPMLYSIIRVVFLSALGALSSDLLGFRVRIWKI